MDKSQLKYHCPDHPDRPAFCVIGDYTPCRECYLRYRHPGKAIVLLMFLLLSLLALTAAPGDRLYRHDPNLACRDIVPDYTAHPLYGSDCNALAFFVEQATGRPWPLEFAKYWLDCHPYDDPLASMDVNFDGTTDLKDFAILSRRVIYYKTRTGTKYHVAGCRYLKTSKIPVITTDGLTPCLVCIVAATWLLEN